ncbi:MAG TPA: carbohydrate ABC transporter permease [Chloroflexi bacterium]|nr:carbohydrate ABC transporter permease [Chloroflexota bacterium]
MEKLSKALIYLALTLGALISLFPFIWMILTSFKSYREVATRVFWPAALNPLTYRLPPEQRPIPWLFHNFVEAWNSAPFARYFFNSIVVSVFTVLGVLITSSLAAYAFARLRFPGRNIIFMLFLATMMIPGEILLIPNFIIIKHLGWYDTYWALIIPWTANVFSIFLLRQFFATIPQELYDAAVLDGCGHFRFLTQIVLPLSRPALTTVALFNFIWSWNAFLWPLIVTSREEMRPIQVGLAFFVTESGTDTQLLMAAATITILPIVTLYFFVQRQFIEGIYTGGIRG